MKNFYEWLNESLQNIDIQIDTNNFKTQLQKLIFSYIGPYRTTEGEYTETDAKNDLNRILVQTEEYMNLIKNKIQQAISQIDNWTTKIIIVEALYNKSINPSNCADIKLVTGNLTPSFMLCMDDSENNIYIDDVLEGGDTDFFNDQAVQNDYFSLIDNLKNLGKPKKEKLLTLYTARPKKDKQSILDNQTLPLNVFLTDNEEHAYGLAHDLAGGEEVRDVWMVKINSKYLTKTLDGPIKYYQLTSDNAPMDIFLVS